MTQPKQPSVEELKECREAFEQDCEDRGICTKKRDDPYQSPDYYFRYETEQRWQTWQAAWNRRTEPSPAEVSSEVNSARKQVGSIITALAEIVRLGDQSRREIDPEVILRQPVMTQVGRIRDSSYAIERALNQRLAVKEGDDKALTPSESKAYESGYSAGLMMGEETGRRSALKDDQQAKDAARYRWLADRFDHTKTSASERILEDFHLCDADGNVDALISLGDAIDTAMRLSNTKQEEV